VLELRLVFNQPPIRSESRVNLTSAEGLAAASAMLSKYGQARTSCLPGLVQGTARGGLELFARALEAAHGEGGGQASYGCEQ
jgi:hypothetical protein